MNGGIASDGGSIVNVMFFKTFTILGFAGPLLCAAKSVRYEETGR